MDSRPQLLRDFWMAMAFCSGRAACDLAGGHRVFLSHGSAGTGKVAGTRTKAMAGGSAQGREIANGPGDSCNAISSHHPAAGHGMFPELFWILQFSFFSTHHAEAFVGIFRLERRAPGR